MGTYAGLNYWKFADLLDVISWDSYPAWHNSRQEDSRLGADIAFVHDINRSLKGGRPFMLMESTPSMTNWQDVSKLKRPGMHELSSLQAVAHGSDTVQYFQWRKSRGSSEKFHGAVVDHEGSEHTRVFQEVKKLGKSSKSWRTSQGRQSNPRPRLYLTGRIAGLWKMPKVRAISESIMNGPPNRFMNRFGGKAYRLM